MNLKKNKPQVHNVVIFSGNSRDANEWSSRLRTQGYAVEVSTGGFHALNLIEKENFDIMLVSGSAPDMSGIEVIAIARTVKSQEQLPIIFIADEGEGSQFVEALDQGANSYVLKRAGYFNDIINKMTELL